MSLILQRFHWFVSQLVATTTKTEEILHECFYWEFSFRNTDHVINCACAYKRNRFPDTFREWESERETESEKKSTQSRLFQETLTVLWVQNSIKSKKNKQQLIQIVWMYGFVFYLWVVFLETSPLNWLHTQWPFFFGSLKCSTAQLNV